MKLLSFSIFDSTNSWEFLFYLRGCFFNCAMARIVYPGFSIHITAERSIYLKYQEFFQELSRQYGAIIVVKDEENLCRSMLWRLEPVFDKAYEYVLARDSDALVTYREAQAVTEFINSGLSISGISDNPAHSSPLMGGLCGFKCEDFRQKYGSYKAMLERSPVEINKKGSDQDFLTKVVYSDFKEKFYWHYGPSVSTSRLNWTPLKSDILLHDKKDKLYLSNLCISFIGTAGVNEFETLRYLRDNGIDLSLNLVGRKYPNIFYWCA